MDIFETLESQLQGWLTGLSLRYAPNAGKEIWVVMVEGRNNWNDEPWQHAYTYSSQKAAWQAMREFGTKWLEV